MNDETLGRYINSYYAIDLQYSMPYNAKPFLKPTIHKPTLKKEVHRLIKTGVLKKIYHFQWAAPTDKKYIRKMAKYDLSLISEN